MPAVDKQSCAACANHGPWRAVYSKVPTGPQAVAVADCPHAFPGTAVTPGSGSHCENFAERTRGVQEGYASARNFPGADDADGVAAAPADLSKHRGEAPTADGMFPGESVAEAARSWQGWCEHRSMTGLALFLGKVATLADGVKGGEQC